MNKIDLIVDNVEGKVNSLNGLFSIIDKTTLKINGIFEKSVDLITKVVDKISFKNKRKDVDEDE